MAKTIKMKISDTDERILKLYNTAYGNENGSVEDAILDMIKRNAPDIIRILDEQVNN